MKTLTKMNSSKYDNETKMFDEKIVEKRTGIFVPFNLEKIKIAISKAVDSIYEIKTLNHEKVSNVKKFQSNIEKKEIINNVIAKLHDIKSKTIHIEDIQDIIISTMSYLGFNDIADVYSNYRKKKNDERNQFKDRIIKLMDTYMNNNTWEIKENANMTYSLQGLNLFLTSNLSKTYWINKVFNKKDSKFHLNGDIHIHDLYNLSTYCCGWDLKDLLHEGFTGCEEKLSCNPPEHFDAAIGQIYNFLYTIQGEVAGAVAFSNVDTLLAPYIRKDNMIKDRSKFKQSFQNLIYNLNVPTRVGFQCVSEDTEILTEAGWKSYDQMLMTDMIVTFNRVNGQIENLPIKALSIYNHTGLMYNFKNSKMDQLVNETHKCLIINEDTTIYDLPYAKDLFKSLHNGISSIAFPYADMNAQDDTIIDNIDHEAVTEISAIYNYDGIIWCPSTDNGTIFAKRNGTVFLTGNSPFTNFSLDLTCPDHMKNEPVYINGKDTATVYGDYQEEIDAFNDMFCEVMMEGDKNNSIFPFPIPTYEIDKNFDWDNPKVYKLWKMTGKYGIPYFANYINSTSSKEDFKSMCPIHGNEYVLIKDTINKCLYHTKIKNLKRANEIYEVYSNGKFVKGRFQIHPNQMMINVKLANGHEKIISRKHLNFIMRNEDSENIEELIGSDLDVGMYLPYSTQVYNSDDGNYDLGYLIGVYAGDGSIENKGFEVIFSLNDISKTSVIDNIINITKKYFGAIYRIKNKKNSITLAIKSKSVVGICCDFVKGMNIHKHLSPKVFMMNMDFKKGLIDGYLATNGDGEKKIYTTSKLMVISLNMLAATLGTITSVHEDNKSERYSENTGYNVSIYLDNHLRYKDKWFKKDDKIWVKIVSIKDIGISTGFCFEVIDDEPMFTIATTGILTHNCRLKIDTTQLKKRGGGLFGAGALVGSMGVVTINMPRIGYLAKDEEDFFKRLDKLLETSKNILIKKSEFIEFQTERGMYPYSKYYLRNIYKKSGKYWNNHFLTIGIIGVNEACINMFDETIETSKSHDFAQKILEHINKRLIEFQKETEYLFNLEASPSEGASYNLWCKDKELYPDMKCFEYSDNQFYTNSSFLPVDSNFNLFKALSHQESLQDKYSGGTVFHGFLGENITDPMVVKNLIRLVLTKYKIPYFNITPTFSICSNHGYIKGECDVCPKCGKETLVYSRVVGYFRATKNFNVGKVDEFNKRTYYDNDVNKIRTS